jgi:hypothetical protein
VALVALSIVPTFVDTDLMGSQDPDQESTRRLDEIESRMQVNRADIDALIAESHRAAARADASQARADASEARADASDARALEDRDRITDLEARAEVDRELLAELQAEGLLNREHVEQLKEALRTSRTIGAAIGIIMANRAVDERGAFSVLRKASSLENRKLRLVAEDVVLTGAVDELPVV